MLPFCCNAAVCKQGVRAVGGTSTPLAAASASSPSPHQSPARANVGGQALGAFALPPNTMAMAQAMAGSPSTPPRAGMAGGRSDRCFSSVCNMSVVHMSCHAHATRAERSIKVPRLEWDGASMRNQNTRCNNLLPFRGPSTPAHMYSEYTERYWATLAQLGRHEGSRFRIMVHDVRILLERLATASSFSHDSGGGSAHSNVKLLPFLVQMGYQCLGDVTTDTSSSTWRQASGSLGKHLAQVAKLIPKHGQRSPAQAVSFASPGGTTGADGPNYYAVAALWFPNKWRKNKRVLLLGMVAQALCAARIKTDTERWWEADGGSAVLEACRVPLSLMALLVRMHQILHASQPPSTAAESSEAVSEASLWAIEAEVLQDKIRKDDVKLMNLCDELVDFYQDELAVSESIGELLDVGDLLQDIGDVDEFMQAAAASAATSAPVGGGHVSASYLDDTPASATVSPERGSV